MRSNVISTNGWLVEDIRSIRNTPAVTRVDECTNAEIGVGAAIAIGNQAENGNWALFEVLAIIRSIKVSNLNSIFILKFQLEDNVISPIDKRIKMSPIRFLRSVMVPDEAAEKFW